MIRLIWRKANPKPRKYQRLFTAEAERSAVSQVSPGAGPTFVWIDPSADAVPADDNYLGWSAALFSIDLGHRVSTIGPGTLVTIDRPEAALAGLLPEALGRMQAPMRFEVRQLITAWRARPALEMRFALGRLCVSAGASGCGGVMTADWASLLSDLVGAAGS